MLDLLRSIDLNRALVWIWILEGLGGPAGGDKSNRSPIAFSVIIHDHTSRELKPPQTPLLPPLREPC